MTTTALKANPKVYWIWNHRRWCLENVPDGPERNEVPSMEWRQANWDKELFVVERMLDADARNCQSSHRCIRTSLTPTLSSPRLELPQIRPREHAHKKA
jgi:hypothetical protein